MNLYKNYTNIDPNFTAAPKPVHVNKCLKKNGGCPAHSKCSHTKGKITCTCEKGYVVKGAKCERKWQNIVRFWFGFCSFLLISL